MKAGVRTGRQILDKPLSRGISFCHVLNRLLHQFNEVIVVRLDRPTIRDLQDHRSRIPAHVRRELVRLCIQPTQQRADFRLHQWCIPLRRPRVQAAIHQLAVAPEARVLDREIEYIQETVCENAVHPLFWSVRVYS